MKKTKKSRLAVWALTQDGLKKASIIADSLEGVDGYGPQRRIDENSFLKGFHHFKTHVRKIFHDYEGHIFIMATGIVVRVIAPLLRDKVRDPAVVVLDEKAQHVISLLSGHLGGANDLAQKIAHIFGAAPVITTATDVHGVKAFDIAAVEKDLCIENPDSIKALNSALLEKRKIYLIDPMKIISSFYESIPFIEIFGDLLQVKGNIEKVPAVYVGDELVTPRAGFLVMRPLSLVAGIGCNRGTDFEELKEGLEMVFEKSKLSINGLRNLSTIELKKDEESLVKLGEILKIPIDYFSSKELGSIKGIENPSQMVKKYTGTEGVCEAAALLSAGTGRLLIPKQILKNMTLAVARVNSTL
ncbi:MAG: cobalt-precorrin 5A hydrolase [Thermodesulfobacteriota bacterium]|nr:cobalt-precorrin 5A hydrolase [Thermodesulfobacteriota bacterium]